MTEKDFFNTLLELGAGIGTLTYTILLTAKQAGLLSKSDFMFYTVENNDYCLQQLAKNLKDFQGSYRVIASTDSLRESGTKFDLIVVDGGGNLPGDMGVMDFADLLNHRGSVFVEGGRRYQRMKITEWYGQRDHVYMKVESSRLLSLSQGRRITAKNKPYHLYLFEPNFFERCRTILFRGWNHYSVHLMRRLMKIARSA